ncbi:MAG TPA: hypothetical protein VM848_09015 [Acidimicrobiia bacterium]|nr:hypothetical protein [Acidimicrobiia bacterium]
MTFFRRFVVLCFCTLLLAACEIRSYMDIDMSDTSNGTVSVQVGFDDQFRDAMEEFGGGTDLVGELEADAPGEGWAVERFQDGDIEGVEMTKEFSSLEELQELLEEGRLSGPQEGLVGEVSFVDTGDTIRFEAEVPEGGDFEGMSPGDMEGLFTYDARITVTFPGEVIDHNGELEENTVTWTFDDPASMAGSELFAEGRKGSGSPMVAIVGVLLGLGVVALVVWQVLSRRKPPSDGLITARLEHHTEPAPEAPVQPSTESA